EPLPESSASKLAATKRQQAAALQSCCVQVHADGVLTRSRRALSSLFSAGLLAPEPRPNPSRASSREESGSKLPHSKIRSGKSKMTAPLAKKVLLIGWDAADWKVATPLLEQGLMPALDDLINHGVMGNRATLQPILSPVLWNSIATGKRADKHGIHGFAEPDPNTGGVRMVSSTSRKVKAIRNIPGTFST